MSKSQSSSWGGRCGIASRVVVTAEKFTNINVLLQSRWFFSNMLQPIACGPCSPDVSMPDTEWRIVEVVEKGARNSPRLLNVSPHRRKQKQSHPVYLHPLTEVFFVYHSYKIAICVEISRAMYAVRADGDIPINDMFRALQSTFTFLLQSLHSSKCRLYITVLAHHSELNVSHGVWQGELTNSMNTDLLMRLLQSRLDDIEDIIFQHHEAAGMDEYNSPVARYNYVENTLVGVIHHLALLPDDACPVALLLTTGVMCVDTGYASALLADEQLSLYVLVVSGADTQPLGCIAEIDELRILALNSSGNINTLNLNDTPALESFLGDMFLRSLHPCRVQISRPSRALIAVAVAEDCTRGALPTYQLEGATLEHLLAFRLKDGFVIVSILFDQNIANPQLQRAVHQVTVRLEKRITKVKILAYEVSFVLRKPSQPLLNRPRVPNFTNGTLSIDISWSEPSAFLSSGTPRDHDLSKDAKVICQYDIRIAKVLGITCMPGFVRRGRATLTSAGSGVTGTFRERECIRLGSIVKELKTNSDLIDEICALNIVCTSHIYLGGMSSECARVGSILNDDSLIYDKVVKLFPEAACEALTKLKWMIVIPEYEQVPLASYAGDSAAVGRMTIPSVESVEVAILRVTHVSAVFIEITVSRLGVRLQTKLLENLREIGGAVFSALEALNLGPCYLSRNLALALPDRSAKEKYIRVTNIYMHSHPSHFSNIGFNKRRIRDGYVNEMRRIKSLLGFQVVSHTTTKEKDDMLLCAVLKFSPTLGRAQSLIQLRILCKSDQVITTYYWEPIYRLAQNKGSNHSDAGLNFQNAEVAQLIMQLIEEYQQLDGDVLSVYQAFAKLYSFTGKYTESVLLEAEEWTRLKLEAKHNRLCLPVYNSAVVTTSNGDAVVDMNQELLRLLESTTIESGFYRPVCIASEVAAVNNRRLVNATYVDVAMMLETTVCSSEDNISGQTYDRSDKGDTAPNSQQNSPRLRMSDDFSDEVEFPFDELGVTAALDSQLPRDDTLDLWALFQDDSFVSKVEQLIAVDMWTFYNPANLRSIISNNLNDLTKECVLDTANLKMSDHILATGRQKLYRSNIIAQLKCNFVLVLYTSLRLEHISVLDHQDLNHALQLCQNSTREIDISSICRMRVAVLRGFANNINELHLDMTSRLFNNTVGKLLTGIEGTEYFLLTPGSSYGIPVSNSMYRLAMFVKVSFVIKCHRSMAPCSKHDTEFVIPATPHDLSAFITRHCRSYCDDDEEVGSYVHSVRLEFLHVSIDAVKAQLEVDLKQMQEISPNNRLYEASLPQLERSVQNLELQSVYLDRLINTITSSMDYYLNQDALSNLLDVHEVTPDVLAHIQSSLEDNSRGNHSKTLQLDFMCPITSRRTAIGDYVMTLFEGELMRNKFEKSGDLYYTRGWSLVPLDIITSPSPAPSPSPIGSDTSSITPQYVPCWILLSILQCTVNNNIKVDDRGIVTMDVILRVRSIESSVTTEELLVAAVTHSVKVTFYYTCSSSHVKVCCHRTNQQILLNNIAEDFVASKYLVKTSITTDVPSSPLPVDAPPPRRSSTTSSTQLTMPDMPPEGSQAVVSSHKNLFDGCFSCPLQDIVTCLIPANKILTSDKIIRGLEAVFQLRVSGVSKCFIYQYGRIDEYGSVYILTLTSVNDTAQLNIYGVKPVPKIMKRDLSLLLENKKIGLVAESLSLHLTLKSTLEKDHVKFLKESGSAHVVHVKYRLPSFVSDAYFFCVLARHMIAHGQLLTLDASIPVKVDSSTFIHPSLCGYDLFQPSVTLEPKYSSSSLLTPHKPLSRNAHVKSNFPDPSVNPVFRELTNPSDLPKHQYWCSYYNDTFRFFYNHASGATKPFVKEIGKGLAVVEFAPCGPSGRDASPIPSYAASKRSLLCDVSNMLKHFMHGGLLAMFPVEQSLEIIAKEVGLSENAKMSDAPSKGYYATRSLTNQYSLLNMRIFAPQALNTQTLVEYCTQCFTRVLEVYCMSRLLEASNIQDSTMPRHNEIAFMKQISPDISRIQLISAAHRLMNQHANVSVPAAIGHFSMPVSLSMTQAKKLHDDIIAMILVHLPSLAQTVQCVQWPDICEDESGYMTATASGEKCWLNILDQSTSSSFRCFLGEHFVMDELQDTEVVADDCRAIPNISAKHAPTDYCKTRLHIVIELIVASTGVYLYHFNVKAAAIQSISSSIQAAIGAVVEDSLVMENYQLCNLGLDAVIVNTPVASASMEAHESPAKSKYECAQMLFWSKRVISRLSHAKLCRAAGIAIPACDEADDFSCIPADMWRRSKPFDRYCIPVLTTVGGAATEHNLELRQSSPIIEDFDATTTLVNHIKRLLYPYDCTITGGCVEELFVIYPVPDTASVFIIEVLLPRDGWLCVQYRMADSEDLVCDIMNSVEMIQSDQSLGVRLKDGGTEVIKSLLNHPLVNAVKNAVLQATLSLLYFCMLPLYRRSLSCMSGQRVVEMLRAIAGMVDADIAYSTSKIKISEALAAEINNPDVFAIKQNLVAEEILSAFKVKPLTDSYVSLDFAEDIVVCFRFVATSKRQRVVTLPKINSQSDLLSRSYVTPSSPSYIQQSYSLGSGKSYAKSDYSSRGELRNLNISNFQDWVSGISLMYHAAGDDCDTLTTTTLLFLTSDVIGCHRGEVLDEKLLYTLDADAVDVTHLQLGPEQLLLDQIHESVVNSLKVCLTVMKYNDAWDVLCDPPFSKLDQSIYDKVTSNAVRTRLVFLDHLLPGLKMFSQPQQSALFQECLRKVYKSRYFYYSTDDESCTKHTHLIIGGKDSCGNFLVRLEISPNECTIDLLEQILIEDANGGECVKQRHFIKTLVEVILYAVSYVL